MDVINATTGSTTTSCGHTFHFNCLANWCIKKVQSDDHQNCPLCRHVMVESERLPEPAADEDEGTDRDEEEEDDEVDEDFQIWQDRIMEEAMARAARTAAGIPEFDEATHALWVMRTTFERLDDGESIDSGEAPDSNQKVALPSPSDWRQRAHSL